MTETVAGEAGITLTLDWALMGNSTNGDDAGAVGRALKDLGTLMVFSRAAPANPIGRTRTLPDPECSLAVVATDGASPARQQTMVSGELVAHPPTLSQPPETDRHCNERT